MFRSTGMHEAKSPLDTTDEFDGLDLSPTFKPLKAGAKPVRDDYEIALTGPAAFMQSAPKSSAIRRPVKSSAVTNEAFSKREPRKTADDTALAECATGARSKMPIVTLAAMASLACLTFLGIQNMTSATANSSFAFSQSSSISTAQRQGQGRLAVAENDGSTIANASAAVPIGLAEPRP